MTFDIVVGGILGVIISNITIFVLELIEHWKKNRK